MVQHNMHLAFVSHGNLRSVHRKLRLGTSKNLLCERIAA